MSTEMTAIESEANARFKRWKKIGAFTRAVKKEGLTLLEGFHLLEVALDNPAVEITALIVRDRGVSDEGKTLIETLVHAKAAPVFLLSHVLYDQIAPVDNGVGVMAEMRLPETPSLTLLGEHDVLYLDGVQDAGNAGTLIRTAVAAGVRVIAASSRTASLFSPKVLRAGMGAHMGAFVIENIDARTLREHVSGSIIAADARGGEDLFNADPSWANERVCWIMGAEGPGVSQEALAQTDRRFYIPIEKSCESLNVGAAAAVCLFEMRRIRLSQRGRKN